jgi:hypothetical protein
MHPEDEKRVQDLLDLHAYKLRKAPPDGRCANLLFMGSNDALPLDACFVRLRADDVTERRALNVDLRSVQWLMQQMQTYDDASELLAGVAFASGEVLAHVIPRNARTASAAGTSRI